MKVFKIHIIVMLSFLGSSLFAQQFPLQSHYLLNDYPWNPAVAGSKIVNPANINYRKQWVGIDDSPQSYSISFHGLLFQYRMAMGVYIFGNTTGPTNTTGLQYTWGYHLPVNGGRAKLSFAASGLAIQHVFDTRRLTLDEPVDPAISGEVLKMIIPEANAGLYYYSDRKTNAKRRYWLGVSGLNLLQTGKRIGKNNNLNWGPVEKHYMAMGGYGFKIVKKVRIEPSFLIKVPESAIKDYSKIETELSGRLVFSDSLWLGISYREGDAAVAMIGVLTGGMSLAYSYDFLQSGLKHYSTGSHEISVIFNFKRRSMKLL